MCLGLFIWDKFYKPNCSSEKSFIYMYRVFISDKFCMLGCSSEINFICMVVCQEYVDTRVVLLR
jgi:hypothetical protein